jgi:hypothetical protein
MTGTRIKPWWVVAAFLSGLALAMWAEELILNWRDNRLEFSAPRVHFLTGKPLERLHKAAQVPFDFQITLWAGNRNREFIRIPQRFVISYDLWDETYQVVKTLGGKKIKSHLTAAQAEAWCLSQMPVDVSGLAANELFWARVDIRTQDGKLAPLFGRESITESGISLNSLIDLFSRPAQKEQPHWTLEAGPLTLDELKRGRRAF